MSGGISTSKGGRGRGSSERKGGAPGEGEGLREGDEGGEPVRLLLLLR